ncbi:MAG: hypothetical protein BWY83_03239 [bacterium ADurb.Bin478]|nr:MAG: hypothetical protein BWY83_03239 [bacterium ADurb.Bin478]
MLFAADHGCRRIGRKRNAGRKTAGGQLLQDVQRTIANAALRAVQADGGIGIDLAVPVRKSARAKSFDADGDRRVLLETALQPSQQQAGGAINECLKPYLAERTGRLQADRTITQAQPSPKTGQIQSVEHRIGKIKDDAAGMAKGGTLILFLLRPIAKPLAGGIIPKVGTVDRGDDPGLFTPDQHPHIAIAHGHTLKRIDGG